MHFYNLHNEYLFPEVLCFLCIYVYIRNIRKIWSCYTSLETAAYFKISFSSFYGKKKVQAVSHAAVPFDGADVDGSDMG